MKLLSQHLPAKLRSLETGRDWLAFACIAVLAAGAGSPAAAGQALPHRWWAGKLPLLDNATAWSGGVGHEFGPVHNSGRTTQMRAPGYLGIEFHDLNDDQAAALHLKTGRGVEILMVDHDGPAGAAGLRPHDVIVTLNGQPVGSAEALRRMIHDDGAGSGIALAVLRQGSTVMINAQLADRNEVAREALARMQPEPASLPQDNTAETGFADNLSPAADPPPPTVRQQNFLSYMLHLAPFTGLALSAMEPQLATFFGAPSGMGLLVQTVMPNSPAAAAGLKAGDVVLRADGTPLHTTTDWTRHVHASRENPITLVVLREKREVTVVLRPEVKHRSELEAPPLPLQDCVLCA